MSKTEDDGKVRFYLEADYRDEPEYATIWSFEDSHEAALGLFDRLSTQYPCVWMAEYGEYRAGNETKRDWIYYRWTKKTNWGDMPGRLTGYPENDQHTLRDYSAIDRMGKRIA